MNKNVVASRNSREPKSEGLNKSHKFAEAYTSRTQKQRLIEFLLIQATHLRIDEVRVLVEIRSWIALFFALVRATIRAFHLHFNVSNV